MIQPCELVVKTLIPSIRAMVAKELISNYDMKQTEVAKMLGVTQAAVSQYLRGARGSIIDLSRDEEIMRIIRRIARGLVTGDLDRKEVSLLMCEVCYQARKKKIYCGSEVKIKGKYVEVAELMCLQFDLLREKSDEVKRMIEGIINK